MELDLVLLLGYDAGLVSRFGEDGQGKMLHPPAADLEKVPIILCLCKDSTPSCDRKETACMSEKCRKYHKCVSFSEKENELRRKEDSGAVEALYMNSVKTEREYSEYHRYHM